MSGERYFAAKRIFVAAHNLPLSDRQSQVSAVCGDDADLLAEVLALFAAADAERTEISDALPPEATSRPMPTISGYTLIDEIARGGMGVVYLAEREREGVRQRVALKQVLNVSLRTPEEMQRFRAERQILAALDHPHIARLVDVGTSDDGVPFLAMEYVDGDRIDVHCRKQSLDVRARVELIVRICGAVDAAHRRLIVHRDLKPGNILIDRHGAPKLLDFGIAKLLDATDLEFSRAQTGTGQQLLTPRYAAPEQIRSEPASTATDVYAIGVILYELLAGDSPYGDTVTAPLSMPRAICVDEPPLPSETALRVAGNHRVAQTSARQLSAKLRGDLDAILMKCLRKRPEERYPGMPALILDLQAWLDGGIVAARRGNRGYRLRRFARRHWILLATTAGIALLTIGFVISLQRELASTAAERDRTGRERDRAEAVTSFMVELFGDADPRQARGEAFTVRQALDRGVARLGTELQGYPQTRAHLLRELAAIYLELGDYDQSLALAEQARALNAPDREQQPLDYARSLYAVAAARSAKGELDQAIAALNEVRALAQTAGDRSLEIEAMNRLGIDEGNREHVQRALDLHAQAEQMLLERLHIAAYAEALQLKPEQSGREDLQRLAMIGQNQCAELNHLGRYQQALARCLLVRDLKRNLWPSNHPLHQSTIVQIGRLQALLGNIDASIATNREDIALTRRIYGDEHTKVAFGMVNLGVDLKALGRYDEAEPLLRGALAIIEKNLGRDHSAYLITLNNLANLRLNRGDVEEALVLHRQVLEGRRRTLGAEDPSVAQSLMNIGNALKALGREDEAIRSSEQALAMYEKVLEPLHPDTELSRLSLSQKYLSSQRWAEAATASQHVADTFDARKDNPDLATMARFVLAQALWEIGSERARARALATQALIEARAMPRESLDAGEIEKWLQAHPQL